VRSRWFWARLPLQDGTSVAMLFKGFSEDRSGDGLGCEAKMIPHPSAAFGLKKHGSRLSGFWDP